MKLNDVKEQGIYHITKRHSGGGLRHDINTLMVSRGFNELRDKFLITWIDDNPNSDWLFSEIVTIGKIQWGDDLEVEKLL